MVKSAFLPSVYSDHLGHASATIICWLNNNIQSYLHPADFPPNSPDLSPIENIWSLGPTVDKCYRDPKPKTVVQLKCRLRQAWRAVPKETRESNKVNAM